MRASKNTYENNSRFLVFLFIGFVLSGCATNGFKKYYNDRTGGNDVTKSPAVILPQGEPQVMSGTNVDEDASSMRENGYELLGFSSFYGPNEDLNGAVKQGVDVHASAVVVYSKYKDTLSGISPVTVPTTQTSYTNANVNAYSNNGGYANAQGNATTTTYGTQTTYVPYSVSRNDYFASYWIKMNPASITFGCKVGDLTTEQRRSISSNKGVLVTAVVKGTPAFDADFMKGDILKKIGDDEISGVESYQNLLKKHKGEKVKVEYVRDGKVKFKTVQFNDPKIS